MKISTSFKFSRSAGGKLLIACGALAKEIIQIIELNQLRDIDVQCLPAQLHHRPALIPKALEDMVLKQRSRYQEIYVIYGDCGTAGGIDKIVEKYQLQRIEGPHCFSFFEGNMRFAESEGDITSFFLTDFFCKHFDKFMWQELGLDRHESMVDFVFGNYEKLVYVAQTEDEDLQQHARSIADKLGLRYEYRFRGYSDLGVYIENVGR